MSQSPSPGWYADPQGLAPYRWWDGLAWTAHLSHGQPAHLTAPAYPSAPAYSAAPAYPSAQQAFASPAVTAAPAWPTQASPAPAPAVTAAQRNQYAFITFGIVALYVLIAWKAHVYVLGVLPAVMSIRSKSRNEPLAVAAIIAAAAAVVIAFIGITHH